MQQDTALDILKNAILLERRGMAFYAKVAEQSAVPAVREFFGMMAREEERHIQILSDQFGHYQRQGVFGAPPKQEQPSPDLASTVLSERLQASIAAADFEAAAISAAMAMERDAIRAYTERADTASDPQEKALYRWLAGWEREHLEFLAGVDRAVTEAAWADNSFWPF